MGLEATSRSLAVTSFAASVEALLDGSHSPGVGKCSKCGQPEYRINARFEDFLTHYAGKALRKEFLHQVYAARSNLVHGTRLYEVDEPLFSVLESGDVDYLVALAAVRAALLNWLLEQAPATASPS